jgi:hypothetical protein
MLTPEQVLPFLLHEDYDVREHAAHYLAAGYESTPELVPVNADHFWESIDRYGIGRSTRLLSRLRDLRQTEASLAHAAAVLASAPDEDTGLHLQEVFSGVDFATLRARRDELLNVDGLHPGVRDHLVERLALAEVPADQLWERLRRDSDQNEGKYIGNFDMRVAERLVEALARHGDEAARLAMTKLADGPGEDWLGLYAVRLLGELRHAPAIDLLIACITTDDDITPASSGKALRMIGSDEVIRKVEAAWATLDSEYDRMVVVDVLKGIKRPDSERALLRLTEAEEDPELLAWAGAGLCDLCTTEGLETVRQLIVQDRYDEGMAELDEVFLTLCKMTGFDPPEVAAWRETVAKRQAERQERMKRFEGPGGAQALIREALSRLSGRSSGLEPVEDDDDEDEAGWDSEYDDDAIGRLPPPAEVLTPIRREAPKVGRNDPCPCGSGKKYKKCCMSKAGV